MYKIVDSRNGKIPIKTIELINGPIVMAVSQKTHRTYILRLAYQKAEFIPLKMNGISLCDTSTKENSIKQMLQNGFDIYEFNSYYEMGRYISGVKTILNKRLEELNEMANLPEYPICSKSVAMRNGKIDEIKNLKSLLKLDD